MLIAYAAAIEGIDRIRYTTSHPAELTGSLIDVYAEVPELVSHLHLPVQSGSDRILALMKRTYTAREYVEKVRRLRAARPDLSLSSDFIVGFPGETDADFEATMDLIDEIGFDTSFSFIYSARPGTPAADLPDPVPLDVKRRRLARLQARISELAREVSQAMVGRRARVLVEGPSKKDPGRASRPHREQPGRQLLRTARARRHVRRRDHRGGAPELVARGACQRAARRPPEGVPAMTGTRAPHRDDRPRTEAIR